MFDNVNVDWHLSHEEGSTDFSDDEAGPDALNGSRTPDHLQHASPDKTADYTRSFQRGARPFSMHTPSRLSTQQAKSSEWLVLDRSNDWPRAMDTSPPALSTQTSESPRSATRTPTALTGMLPPPPPNTKKPSMCKCQLPV
jgi:Arf-GAP/SH3 domain/ANK repeat/PH domain-containing protein